MKKISLIFILSTLFLVACVYEEVDYDNNLNQDDFENYEEDVNEEIDKIDEEIIDEPQQKLSLKEFNDCLADNGMIIYGANWCGICISLIQTLGGYDKVENVYIECTENQQLCQSEGITGYPTIKINDEPYRGQRSLQSFSEATGCQLPV